MMKNKKLAALLGLLLAGSMTVSMAACGSTNSASDTKADSSSQSSDSSSSDSSSDSGAGFDHNNTIMHISWIPITISYCLTYLQIHKSYLRITSNLSFGISLISPNPTAFSSSFA